MTLTIKQSRRADRHEEQTIAVINPGETKTVTFTNFPAPTPSPSADAR